MNQERLSPEEVIAHPESWASPDLPFLPTRPVQAQLGLYITTLLAWNKKLNLTGASETTALMSDLVQDSFFLASFLDNLFRSKGWTSPLILDLGAGAGLPGIPLRLLWQKGDYILIERRQKRALFLKTICSRLKLEGVSVFGGDARAFFASLHGAQCILGRAFMPWRDLAAFCKPGLAPNGFLVVMANDPPPVHDLSGWQKAAEFSYRIPGKTRWLWAMEQCT